MAPPVVPPRGTTLAFDFGHRRIGIAVGEPSLGTASALNTIGARGGKPVWRDLDRIVGEWRPTTFVVGVPHHADGSESALGADARTFGTNISDRYGIAVIFVDESLTSREANMELRRNRRSGLLRRRIRNDDSDRIAARLILETWLAHLAHEKKENRT